MSDNSPHKHILDNQDNTVVDYLRQHLPNSDVFRLVSAYFSIYGFETIQNELDDLKDVRFLFGDPGSVGELDLGGKVEKAYVLTEVGLSPNHTLQQKFLARRCAEWAEKNQVKIRSAAQSNFLHGKMYLVDRQGGHISNAVVGSSNFTRRGLGDSPCANLEINLATDDKDICDSLRNWFDKLWRNENLTKDVKHEVLAELARIGEDFAPELIYYKTLYELFHEEIDRRKDSNSQLKDTHLYDTKIWEVLYEFQKDGVKSAISRLLQHNGCILADSVGLGKTYTALAIIKFFELKNERVLVLCPKKLRESWALYINNYRENQFLDDRFSYTLLSHTDLSRYSGYSGNVNFANFNWGNFDMVVIDESHNFRNESRVRTDADGNKHHSRYSRLLEEIIKSGPKTKVLMLSATPVNTSLKDLQSQIYLMTEKREDVFRESLGIGHIGNVLSQAQKKFKKWENSQTEQDRKNKLQLLENLDPDFFQLLGGISIARSKKHIKDYYADELTKIGHFPEQLKPINHHPKTDNKGELSYEELTKQIEDFSLSIYSPSKYIVGEKAKLRLEEEKQRLRFNQIDREHNLIGMIRTNFLKRLESSAHSLTKTLGRTVDKIDVLLGKIDVYEKKAIIYPICADVIEDEYVLPDEDENNEDEDFFVNRARNPYHLSELDLPNWKTDLLKDKKILAEVLDRLKVITPDRDGKLIKLRQDIKNKIKKPSVSKDSSLNRKVLVFTTFKDTAEYIYDNLKDLTNEFQINMALVSGDTTGNEFNTTLTNFAPLARGRDKEKTDDDIDLLIATDCISEGQNLQDCDTVINYDIHWNPVKIIQRFGRIDRIGSRNQSVQMINYWPNQDMDVYLHLKSRVKARMALVDAVASGDDDPLNDDFTPSDEGDTIYYQSSLDFRGDQLKKLQEEVLDLDDLSDNIVMSDFTLDDFFAHLLRYLEKNKDVLDAVPSGAYAITGGTGDNFSKSGVIFFLRYRNTRLDKGGKSASPIHPYYTVYIYNNGDIRFGCATARQVLELFKQNAVGKTTPSQKLCDWFDQKTQNGSNMSLYNQLLKRTIEHINNKNANIYTQYLSVPGQRDLKFPEIDPNKPKNDLDLITWLVIKNEHE